MIALGHRLRDYAASLAGRITLLLAVGMASASLVSLFIAGAFSTHQLKEAQLDRVVASSRDMADRFARDPARTEASIVDHQLFGVREPMAGARLAPADPMLITMLREGLPARADPVAAQIVSECFAGMFDRSRRVAGMEAGPAVDCWQVGFTDSAGIRRSIILDLPGLTAPRSKLLFPVYVALILVASIILSALAARLATVPLRRLSAAARSFSVLVDPEPIPESGPSEVRGALATFNLMQNRVRRGFQERTQILAGIAHDLQTPLTRLRLRLEQVPDATLRDRLIGDLHGTQALVRIGLDLARSSESREPWSIVDIDSLVGSVVEDAADMGGAVTLAQSCGLSARVKPDALTRCLTNIVDNAVKYGGTVAVRCRLVHDRIEIVVRDDGHGFPPDRIQDMLEPFVRGDAAKASGADGTGIGLTIAKAQAQTFGAALVLENHPAGGAMVTLRFGPGQVMNS